MAISAGLKHQRINFRISSTPANFDVNNTLAYKIIRDGLLNLVLYPFVLYIRSILYCSVRLR